jgi:hypothetical protein
MVPYGVEAIRFELRPEMDVEGDFGGVKFRRLIFQKFLKRVGVDNQLAS